MSSAHDPERMRSWAGTPGWLADMLNGAPDFAEGLARMGDVVNADGALPARYKQLYTAAVAAVKLDRRFVRLYLRRAIQNGVPLPEVRSVSITLQISRGIPAQRLYVDSLREITPGERIDPVEPAMELPPVPEILEYYASVFGEIPDVVQLLADEAPRALEGYYLMRRSSLETAVLPPLHAELVLVAVNASEYEPSYVAVHARGARRAGATEPQLVEAVLTAIPVAGIAAWLPGARGILDSRES